MTTNNSDDDDLRRDRLDDLIAAHPKLFRGKPPRVPSELPNGWFTLVDALCTDLEQILGDQANGYRWQQIKEKFGSARLYWTLDHHRQPLHADIGGVRLAGDGGDKPGEKGTVEHVSKTPMGMRISIHGADALSQRIAARVRAAEEASETLCIKCGAKARLRVAGGDYHVSCAKHAQAGAMTAEAWRKKREAAAAAKRAKEGGNGD